MQALPISSTSSATSELQKLLTLPPPGWNPSQQHQQLNPMSVAHAALQALRESGDEHFLFLRTILEVMQQQQQQQHNGNFVFPEELVFHCITGCRHATFVRWQSLSPAFRNGLRNFFMILGQDSTLDTNSSVKQHWDNQGQLQLQQRHPAARLPSRTLQLASYTTCACFWKRDWSDGGTARTTLSTDKTMSLSHEQQILLESMTQLFPLPPIHTQHDLFDYWKSMMQPLASSPTSSTDKTHALASASSAATFFHVLTGEFAGKSRVSYQMPLEFHRLAHGKFENDGWLDRCLDMNLTALGQVLTSLVQINDSETFLSSSNAPLLSTGLAIVQCLNDIIGWEFGTDAWESLGMYQNQNPNASTSVGSSHKALRPPSRWQNALMRPDLWQGLLQVYPQLVIRMASASTTTNRELSNRLVHSLSELILALASLQGPIWPDVNHRLTLCSYLVQGTLQILSALSSHLPIQQQNQQQFSIELTQQVWLDALALVNRIIANFHWSTLSQLSANNSASTAPLLVQLVQAIASVATSLWQAHLSECEALQGDMENMEQVEWREEALSIVLDGLVLLLAGGSVNKYNGKSTYLQQSDTSSSTTPSLAIEETMGYVYSSFVLGRIQMTQWEERFLALTEHDADDAMMQREEISAVDLQEEMASVATIGRWHLGAALSCLSSLASSLFPQLQAFWADSSSLEVSPQAAALLEGVRLWSMCLGHLITDDNTGETPIIPEAIMCACQDDANPNGSAVAATTQSLVSAMQILRAMAEEQVAKLMVNPSDPRLSPMLATSLLWTLQRWAPAYILPVDWGTGRPLDLSSTAAAAAAKPSQILTIWSGPEQSQQAVTFCLGLCLHYQCYWPQERQVQENASLLLISLAKRSELRPLMIQSPAMHQVVTIHCLTAGLRHGAPPSELEASVRAKLGSANNNSNSSPPNEMIHGYHRLPYKDRSRILTAILMTSCDSQDVAANAMWNESLKSVAEAFQSLVQAISSKQVSPSDVHAREMTCLCVEMFRGVARSSEITDPERIALFITPTLRPWCTFMAYYADDLTICEGLLGFFRDYSEQFVAFLSREQCLVLFETSADLLKAYASVQSGAGTGVPRSIRTPSLEKALKEEQSYNDVLCAIELLIHLGTKDFLDICSTNVPGQVGIESRQVTDIIFFGLQQIIPLMTQGLLQYPTLCTQYFSLVGFMMDTYQEQVSALPLDLFHALLESLLWGMSHHDTFVSKSCLQGIASLVREHLKSGRVLLHRHLVERPDLFDTWNRRLLQDIVLQPIVWDRLEPAGMALLPLAAVDLDRFSAIMMDLALGAFGQQQQQQQLHQHQAMDPRHRSQRIQSALQRLLQPDVVGKVGHGGYEGRMNRIRFKKDFEVFVQDIHSFLFLV